MSRHVFWQALPLVAALGLAACGGEVRRVGSVGESGDASTAETKVVPMLKENYDFLFYEKVLALDNQKATSGSKRCANGCCRF